MDGLHATDLANQGNDGFSKIRDTFLGVPTKGLVVII